jgi:lipid-A-disaccharide synthase
MVSRVMMIAGEASGDMHGAGVVRELKARRPTLEIFGIGGDQMQHEGMELVHHISSMSVMGFIEVVKHLAVIREAERDLKLLLEKRRPDVVVLIDYPEFNLRFARAVKKRAIKILYYISPQVWAWRPGRVKKMKRLVDKMKVVFPFEVEIYRNEGIDVEWVGHPLVELIGAVTTKEEFFRSHGFDLNRKLVALFPGSRRQELANMLPMMLEVARSLEKTHHAHVALGVAPNLGAAQVREFISSGDRVRIVEGATYELMAHADAAIVTSGTATLETGWFATPMVVVYKTSRLSYLIGRALVKTKNIALVNIVLGTSVVPELLQNNMHPETVTKAVERILDDQDYASGVRRALMGVKTKLGPPGASSRVAQEILELGDAA